MKVGTDGVLLGAWVDIDPSVERILDVGTGTGLIALQCAQRSPAHTIDALEIDPASFEQSVENFEQSPWGDRLFCYHCSFEEFFEEPEELYDLIVSNPPYYTSTNTNLKLEKARAKHNQHLPFEQLLEGANRLLDRGGTLALILPYAEEKNFLKLAERFDFYPLRITRIRGNEKAPLKRSLIQLQAGEKTIGDGREALEPEILVLEEARHEYTEEFKALVKDFYLKL